MTLTNTFHIAALQSQLIWEDPYSNRSRLQEMIKSLENEPVDLIILPEMFTTGFTMNAGACSENPKGKTLEWMRMMAAQRDAAITGSVIVKDEDQFFNRLYFAWPDGRYETYDKRHTFSYAGEDQFYSRGHERLIAEYKGWRICPLICYDLRFPVWSRNTENFDVLIYVANWPASRIQAWETLLRARAIENMCYTIGVNRVGQDGNEIHYNGHSALYDPLGVQSAGLEDSQDGILNTKLEKSRLSEVRNRYRFLDDRDEFELKV